MLYTHPFPKPPSFELKQANHYWLDIYDCDGHYFGCEILQWAPGAQQWCHSGNLATEIYVYVSEFAVINCKQEMPAHRSHPQK